MRRDFASMVIIAGVLSVVGWSVWFLQRPAPAEQEQVVPGQVVNAVAPVTRQAPGVSTGLEAETSSLPPSQAAGDILITVAPEADDGSGEPQELTLEQVRDTIRMTRQDLAVSAPVIEDLERKVREAGGEIVYGTPYFDNIEAFPEQGRDFINHLQLSLEEERHREAWRRDKLQRYESALEESGHAL